MTTALLEVSHLKVEFAGRRGTLLALDDVSFEIRHGETLGLVGESGCGKSTVGRTLLRLYKPTAGRIVFDGIDVTTLAPHQRAPCTRAARRSAQ